MTTTTTGHVRKRQYQPSITSYFNRDTDAPALQRVHRTTSPLSPPLPAETQASLLSVGMRVRKSVPEGYKTHKTLGTEGVPFPSSAPAAPIQQTTRSQSNASTRELMPFCGLHKIGGWAMQEVPTSSAPAALRGYDEEEDEVPGMTRSQSTFASTQSSFMSLRTVQPPSSKKRTYEEEVEDGVDAYFDEVEAEESIERHAAVDRPIARMKGGARRQTVQVLDDDDFEEAAFLAPPDRMEMYSN